AIYSNTGSYTGFSFAIPTTIVKKVMSDLRQYGTVQRAVLGCTVRELDSKLAKEKNITATKKGLVVVDITPRSTAAMELALRTDDVIVEINGTPVGTFPELTEQINRFRPGDKISVTFYRNNQRTINIGTLRNNQGSTEITKKGDFSELGCAFMKLSADTKNHLGISAGVQVTGMRSGLMKDAGIKDGFIIVEINGERVNSADDVEAIYNDIMRDDDSDKVMFVTGLYPTGKKGYYAVNLSAQ
ncbi:MAG: PDZ domain-containing protein, partial [Muribaculaceae bacterium]|nr:PDZ domain-containing protein [Muribaculaceae bacterium]